MINYYLLKIILIFVSFKVMRMEKHEPIVEDFVDKYCKNCTVYEYCGKEDEEGLDLGFDTFKGRDMLKLCILTKILENIEK